MCAPFFLLCWVILGKVTLVLFESDEIRTASPARAQAALRRRPSPPRATPGQRSAQRLAELGPAAAGAFGAWLALRDDPEDDSEPDWDEEPESEDPDPDSCDPDASF